MEFYEFIKKYSMDVLKRSLEECDGNHRKFVENFMLAGSSPIVSGLLSLDLKLDLKIELVDSLCEEIKECIRDNNADVSRKKTMLSVLYEMKERGISD